MGMKRGITERFSLSKSLRPSRDVQVDVTVWSDDTVDFRVIGPGREPLISFSIDPTTALSDFLQQVEAEDWDWKETA